jgi:sugar phosphate isomerase/epimerase
MTNDKTSRPQIALVVEAFADRPLTDVMAWMTQAAPAVRGLEIGTGGYAPTSHCDMPALLRDEAARKKWLAQITDSGLKVAALNCWGNPLHPDPDVAHKHDADLRDTIRLAALLGVDRVVALAGCPAAASGDRTPHFAGGGWLPYLEGLHEEQWKRWVEPYWSGIAEFAAAEHPQLLICLELHPGTAVYNVETFDRIAALGDSIAANIDPSHFFWMHMDPLAVVAAIGDRIGHCHGKDVAFQPARLAVNGLLDRRWPRPAAEMPWNFAVVGRGRPASWWQDFVGALAAAERVRAIAIEHEDPFVSAEEGIPEAAAVLLGGK